MSWAAANLPSGESEKNADPSTTSRVRKRGETIEAALSRLSKAYSTAMECIGSMHSLNSSLMKKRSKGVDDEVSNNYQQSLRKVALAGRNILEQAVLLDPLVLANSPALQETMQQYAKRGENRWTMLCRPRPEPAEISSKAHRSTIRQLSYLALTNYADLLVAACICEGSPSSPSRKRSDDILEKGVVKKLEGFLHNSSSLSSSCCWEEDTAEDVQRLALVALCDAASLDGSDPVVWLKLGCAARALWHIKGTLPVNPFRRLERHALESGYVALPAHTPPNRAVAVALGKVNMDEEVPSSYDQEVFSSSSERQRTHKLHLDLTRYSWSLLGRALIRACRDGQAMDGGGATSNSNDNETGAGNRQEVAPFGSPSISLTISPMLLLPSMVLTKILLYLDQSSIHKLEGTCRALSVSLMSVRAAMEKNDAKEEDIVSTNEDKQDATMHEEQRDGTAGVGNSEEKMDEGNSSAPAVAPEEPATANTTEAPTRSRTSTRVRSKQISSDKKDERSRRRKSVRFCLRAATLSCTVVEEKTLGLRTSIDWDVIGGEPWKLPSALEVNANNNAKGKFASAEESRQSFEASERVGGASLASFVGQLSSQKARPADLLQQYIGHVALNVEDVFLVDPGDTTVLTTTITGCFDLFSQRIFPNAFRPSFFEEMKGQSSLSLEDSLEIFAADVLRTEMRFKTCESQQSTTIEYDDDSNYVSCMVPALLRGVKHLNDGFLRTQWEREWLKLKTRVNWLVASVFLWRSRLAHSVYESIEAEELGLQFIDATIECLEQPVDKPIQEIATPQLESLRRNGSHWRKLCKESLSIYREEIKASSVVSQAQQKFQERVTKIAKDVSEKKSPDLAEEDISSLSEICQTLLQRYDAPFAAEESKHRELLDNFMSMHGNELLDMHVFISDGDEGKEPETQKLDAVIPVGTFDAAQLAAMSNPSILTILVACLQVMPEKEMQVTLILIRLVLVALDRYAQICDSEKASQSHSEDGLSDSEDNDSADMEASSRFGSHEAGKGVPPSGDALKVGRLIKHLLVKVRQAIMALPCDKLKGQVTASGEFIQMVHHCLGFCSRWTSDFVHQPSALEGMLDREVFMAARDLVHSLFENPDVTNTGALKDLYFGGLTRIIASAQTSFASLVRVQGTIRARRAVRQRICIQRAEFIGALLCEISFLLSDSLFTISERRLSRSKLLDAKVFQVLDGTSIAEAPIQLFVLCESLIWFSEYAKHGKDESSSSFDRPIIDRLRVPLAAAIISICGSGSRTRSKLPPQTSSDRNLEREDQVLDRLSLSEFLDSDASAHELSEGEEDSSQGPKTELLRVLCHIVHCVALVFGGIDEKEIVTFRTCGLYKTKDGPLLPLVVTRVLNYVADILLQEFADTESDDDTKGLWSHEYPFSTAGIGSLLDSALYKAYKCLHGFTLVSGSEVHPTKDHVKTSSAEIEIKKHFPESHRAAARLYRCIMRAGKKTPPMAALETVSSALPPLEETSKSVLMKSFLFSDDSKTFNATDVVRIVTKEPGWQEYFAPTNQWLGQDKIPDSGADTQKSGLSEKDDEAVKVRMGLLNLLAAGDLPAFSNEVGGKEDERAGALAFEEAISKKFLAILNTLCFGNAHSLHGWFRAAQCLMLKCNFIGDRLGLSLGFSRNANFFIPEIRPPSVSRLSADELEEKQEQELISRERGWIPFLGNDLSLYVNQVWSGNDSLRALSQQILLDDCNASHGEEAKYYEQAKREIEDMDKKGRHAEWQQAWGSMAMAALQKMAIRCMCTAMYIFYEHPSMMESGDKTLIPEILESLCVTFYSNLLGSQRYGYPMHVMPKKRKRLKAFAALACCEKAVELARALNSDDTEVWDLVFMIGKCHEKIASTYKQERYMSYSLDAPDDCRLFEKHMKEALNSYRAALDEPGDSHGEAGGSSHGTLEILYRLHASRLKCLLVAAVAGDDEREMAEQEALRLAEMHRYSKGDSTTSEGTTTTTRERVWNALTDVVSALAQCRLDHPFFHRSVYRHAQAIMWAPVLYDPETGWVEGSKGTIPSNKSFQLRGLNHSTNVAKSALAVFSVLFEKKRSQLCAVWVTTSYPPTTFETLNNNVRKYDSLRGKYLSGYIDCLRICQHRNELETLLRWIASTKRDLPSVYHHQANATKKDGKPEKSHANDTLLVQNHSISSFDFLTGLKRQANAAMAQILTEELVTLAPSSLESHLKLAYACYLRLNCSVSELKKTDAWKYEPGGVCEVEALCSAFLKIDHDNTTMNDPNDWSGGGQRAFILNAALKKCHELFPSLSGNFFSKKSLQKPKNQAKAERRGSAGKDASLAGKKRSFEVKVPEGLREGETFTTTISTDGETSKKVKLTVPSGEPTVLRFSVDEGSDLMQK